MSVKVTQEPKPVMPTPRYSSWTGGSNVKQDWIMAARMFVLSVFTIPLCLALVMLLNWMYEVTK